MLEELTIGKRLKHFREKAGLTQNGLADKLQGYNRNNIAQYEKDLAGPPYAFLRQFCPICNTSYSEIIDGTLMQVQPTVEQNFILDLINESGMHEKKKAQLKTEVEKLFRQIDLYKDQLADQDLKLSQQKQKIIDFLKERL